MRKLYDLPRGKNIKLYWNQFVIIFDHIDGLYSYCWLEDDKTNIVHIKATTELRKYKDGYKIVESR